MVAVAQELVSYLLAHPGACDTADGILRWWFETENLVSSQSLKEALVSLVERGLLEASPAADGRVRFKRRADTAALRAFLNETA
jgi:hypothetical protein